MPAPLPRRLLAAFIDYLVLFCFFQVGASLPSEWAFPSTLALALTYFSCGYSVVTGGATMGKRLFGLSVRNQSGEYLGLSAGLLRFMGTFGVIILAVEVPPLIYRSAEISASLFYLEIPMLLALAYFFANIAHLLATPCHLGLHDVLASSVVVENAVTEETPDLKPQLLPASAGAGLGLLFWLYGLSYPAPLKPLMENRYVIENKFELRGLSLEGQNEILYLSAIALGASSEANLLSLTKEIVELSPSYSFVDFNISELVSGRPSFPEESLRVSTKDFSVSRHKISPFGDFQGSQGEKNDT